jgi:transcriptional regulator with XRE-family HTH domain
MSSAATKERVVERIVQLRREQGVSQKRLAAAIGVDPSSMNRIEKGERAVSVVELVGVADFFGVSAESILRGDESGGLLFRMEGQATPSLDAPLRLFRGVIRDYFGARATVS